MSAIWYHNAKQKKDIKKSKAQLQRQWLAAGKDSTIGTVIKPLHTFTLAEGYHQKYYLRSHDILVQGLGLKSDLELINSHEATRLNGYVAGKGTYEQLFEEIDSWKLSEEGKRFILDRVQNPQGKSKSFFCM